MRDVTNKFLDYLEAKRHLWNVHFLGKAHSIRDEVLDDYEAIDRLLFSALVMREAGQKRLSDSFRFGSDPLPAFKVVPRKGIGNLTIMVSDAQPGQNRVWSQPLEISTKGVELAFIAFFEWDLYGFVSYPYYRTRVIKLPNAAEYIGHDALIQTVKAGVFMAKGE